MWTPLDAILDDKPLEELREALAWQETLSSHADELGDHRAYREAEDARLAIARAIRRHENRANQQSV